MSNNKRAAGAPTANGPTKGPGSNTSNPRAVFEKLNRIREQIDELAKDNTGRQGYEQHLQELQSKSKEVEETRQHAEAARAQYEKEIGELRTKYESEIGELKTKLDGQMTLNRNLHDSQRDRAITWDADTKRLQAESAELSKVQHELDAVTDELDAVTEDREKCHHKYSQLREKYKSARDRMEELERDNSRKDLKLEEKRLELEEKESELQKIRKTLQELNDELGLLPLHMGVM